MITVRFRNLWFDLYFITTYWSNNNPYLSLVLVGSEILAIYDMTVLKTSDML